MPPKIQAKGRERDERFGVFRKKVKAPNLQPFETPTKSFKNIRKPEPPTLKINEIVKRVTPNTVESIQSGEYPSPRQMIRNRFLPNKLNLVIFQLMHEAIPPQDDVQTIINYLYASSESTLFLPTIRIAMLRDDRRLSSKKVDGYIDMMRSMIEITENTGNTKAFIGTVPLMAPKFSRKIVNLYLRKGITAFAIDGGTKDFLNHVADFRTILSEIAMEVPLENTFIYACNLGIPKFVLDRARADDFLSVFAYVDVIGSNFKTRGGPGYQIGERKAKQFVREHLFYKMSNYYQFCEEHNLTRSGATRWLEESNQIEQLKEADQVRKLVGERRIQDYLGGKAGVDEMTLKRLDSVTENVKIT